jgi:hypothetical protein
MQPQKLLKTGIALLALCVVSSPALAKDARPGINIGQLSVVPSLKYKVESNDNIYLQNTNEEDDFLHTITPSIAVALKKDRDNYLRAGYNVDVVRYVDNNDNNFETHRLTFGAAYKAPTSWYIKLNESFVDTQDPYTSDNDYRLGDALVKRWNNTANFATGYNWGERMQVELNYRNYRQEYDAFEDQWQNYQVHEPGVNASYQLVPKTSVMVEYRLEAREYYDQQNSTDNNVGATSDNAQDFAYHKMLTGLRWDATAFITGAIKLGWGIRDYDNETSFRGVPFDDSSSLIAETDLAYKMSKLTSFSFKFTRSTKDSSVLNSNEYTSSMVGLGVKQVLTSRYSCGADFRFTNDNYDQGREDDKTAGIVYLNYKANKWLGARVNYAYEERDSTDQTADYKVNKFYLSATASL